MEYNFDRIIDRRGTDCLKYDFAEKRGMPADILPLWVADMDFQTPPGVIQALRERAEHGIFGYTDTGERYFSALAAWQKASFGWEPQPDWLLTTPSVVFALNMAIQALTREGEAVLIQQPVYYPFSSAVRNNDRKLVVNELVYRDGKYSIDLDDFERKIVDQEVKLFILCSPHNPVGRVWTRDELTAMGDLCMKHGVKVVSDEIHADFTYPGHQHTVFASVKPEFANISLTCTSPSKTFNLAGLQIANTLIPDGGIRRAVRRQMNRAGYDQVGVMGMVACRAAYETGRDWLKALLPYLADNMALIRAYLQEHLPAATLVAPEGTYLAWVDCRALGYSDKELDDRIVNRGNLWLDGGTMFGTGGEGFQRFNVACPRATLEKAMAQFVRALQ